MAWEKSNERPYRFPMWVNDNTHFILRCGRLFLLFELGKKGIQSHHNTLEEAQAAAA